MNYDWQRVVVRPTVTIKSVLETLDIEALRIVLICDDEMRLIGVVTDGDVRRGLLHGLSLDSEVTSIMNRTPTTVSAKTSRPEAMALMQSKNILAVPILDGNKLVGLQTLQKPNQNRSYDNPIFIMAGGFGTRLRPLTDNTPKPMLKVGDKPILEILINRFKAAGFFNFYISTHYLPEKITEYFLDGAALGVKITYVYEKTPLGTGGALGLLPESVPDLPLIMINGDVLTSVDFESVLRFHCDKQSMATMCVREYEYQVPYGVIVGENQKIVSMEEKPIQRFFVNAGIYVIEPEVFKGVRANHVVDMPTLLQSHIDKGKEVSMFPIHEYWLDIGRMDDYKKAQLDIWNIK